MQCHVDHKFDRWMLTIFPQRSNYISIPHLHLLLLPLHFFSHFFPSSSQREEGHQSYSIRFDEDRSYKSPSNKGWIANYTCQSSPPWESSWRPPSSATSLPSPGQPTMTSPPSMNRRRSTSSSSSSAGGRRWTASANRRGEL